MYVHLYGHCFGLALQIVYALDTDFKKRIYNERKVISLVEYKYEKLFLVIHYIAKSMKSTSYFQQKAKGRIKFSLKRKRFIGQ